MSAAETRGGRDGVLSASEGGTGGLSSCWCGNKSLEVFGSGYLRCARCQTLVLARMPDPRLLLTADDEGFYGRQYYEYYVTRHLGYPSITERARTDLYERCLYWLRALLRHKVPPGRVLELGSAHGGFVALMRWAGFDAIGLEMSPWLVGLAREAFGVPMLLGPVEGQDIAPESLDALVLMDLIEHLPDPVGTMRRCLELLKPDGMLLIQTPKYQEGKSFDVMVAEADPFLKHLTPPQHLYLFSEKSICNLLTLVGVGHVQFEPAIFAAYDMSLAASRLPLRVFPDDQIDAKLAATPSGRLVRALCDLDVRLAESEADRAARLRVIMQQEVQLGRLESERNMLRAELGTIEQRLVAAERLAGAQEARVQSYERLLHRIQQTRPYRILRSLALWRWVEEAIDDTHHQ